MTAAVPDPRFRDQLAEITGCAPLADSGGAVWCETHGEDWPCKVGRIEAVVEARVQAAANQGAAEELRAAADEKVIVSVDHFREILRARAAALASPAPAPRAEEGQETALERQHRVASQRLSQIPKAYQ